MAAGSKGDRGEADVAAARIAPKLISIESGASDIAAGLCADLPEASFSSPSSVVSIAMVPALF